MSTRQIKDAVNHSTGELVYFKGHAKATFMSDGKTVEDAINSIEIPSLDDYVTETELNDKGFLTEHQDISHLASRNWVETQGYAHQEDLLEISFNDIQDSPISIDDSGMINFVDESGNVGFQINEEGLRVTDVIAGEHKLSEKANVSDIPSLDGYAKTSDIPSIDGFVKSEDLPNFDEFAKTNDIPSLDGYAKTEDIPSLDDYASKEWVNNKNYATEYELKTIDYSSINNVPVSEDETGELNIADESGNIGMKVASEAVYAKDFVAGEHKLSNKQDTITDLETIRQGAAKGATALQSYTEQYTGTVTGVKINGTTKNPSSGVVDLGTVITTHQDISGKQDNLVSGTNIKTINGESLLGSGDIAIYRKEIIHLGGQSITIDQMLPDKVYVVYLAGGSFTISSFVDSGYGTETPYDFAYEEYLAIIKTAPGTNVSLTLPDNLLWANGEVPSFEMNTFYELSITKHLVFNTSYYKAVLTPFKPVE